MKTKIVGILVCMLLIATVLPISANIANREKTNIYFEKSLNNGWVKTFGGSGDDNGYCVKETSDGGYIIVGETDSFGAGGDDVWLIKTDADGNEMWSKTYGGADHDGGLSLDVNLDGSYIISGYTYSYAAGECDAWLLKTDVDGNELWNTTFGGPGRDWSGIIFQTDDGGYITQGSTESFGAGGFDGWLIKTDENGIMMWNKTYGGTGHEFIRDIALTDDGGYVLIGQRLSEDQFKKVVVWLIKTDADGNEMWNQTYKGTWGHSFGTCAQPTTDGGYIITGQTHALVWGNKWLGRGDTWLIKTDGDGNKVWDKKFGRFIFEDCCFYIIQTSDGGYLLSGMANGLGGIITQYLWAPLISKASMIKTDADGNLEWEDKIGKGTCGYVQETSDSGCIGVGHTGSPKKAGDIFLVKKDSI